jgi:hypothetical protein
VNNTRVDLGHRLFVAAYIDPLVIGALFAIAGFGYTDNIWVGLLGLGNLVLLSLFANQLYSGERRPETFVRIVAGVALLGAVVVLVLGAGNLAALYLVSQLLVLPLFAALLALPPVRLFLRSRRGEVIEEAVEARQESLWQRREAPAGVAVREEAKPALRRHALLLRVIGGLVLVCGVAGIALGLLGIIREGAGFSLVIIGLLAILPGLAVMSLADDWRFLATTQGHEKNHLANIVADTDLLRKATLTAAIVVALLFLVELMSR